MAKPISATPILRGKTAVDFLTTMHENATKMVGPVPTPKLAQGRKLVEQHAKCQQK
jgi:hypothetical protein